MAREPRPCAHCGETKYLHARQMCNACYQRTRRAATAGQESRRPTGRRDRTVVCAECDRSKTFYARGLCSKCYRQLKQQGRLDEYPVVDHEDVDEVVVDRAVSWLLGLAGLPWRDRRRMQQTTRPRLTRAERVEVLKRTRYDVSPAVALEALGVGKLYRYYLETAGLDR